MGGASRSVATRLAGSVEPQAFPALFAAVRKDSKPRKDPLQSPPSRSPERHLMALRASLFWHHGATKEHVVCQKPTAATPRRTAARAFATNEHAANAIASDGEA